MADSQKFVLMLQPNRFQGFIWKAMLKSQQISVIWETPDTDLKDSLTQLNDAKLTLPHLLIVDMQCLGDNPYAFCRWCRDNYDNIKLILTNASQKEIAAPERDWARHQGAADLLPGFQRDNLVSSATVCVKRALEVLDQDDMNDGALISVLLKLRRELEARQNNANANAAGMEGSTEIGAPTGAGAIANGSMPAHPVNYPGQGHPNYGAYPQQGMPVYAQHQQPMGQGIGQPMGMNGQVSGQPMPGQSLNGQMPMQQPMNGQMPGQVPMNANGYPLQNGQPLQTNGQQNSANDEKPPKKLRRYRGVWY